MQVGHLIEKGYEAVTPYAGTASVEEQLLKNSFLVVLDQGVFRGVLTPADIVESSHRLVVDCLREKPYVDCEQEVESILELMRQSLNAVLPVFKGDEFIGVVTQARITDYLVEYRNDLEQAVTELTEKLARVNAQLQAEVAQRKGAEEALRKANDDLERRVEEHTAELKTANEQLRLEIEKHKLTEEALRESEKIARALLDTPLDAVFLIDPGGNILDANETGAQRFGYHLDELMGMNIYKFTPPDVIGSRKTQVTEVIESGKPVRFEAEQQGIWNDVVLYPILDAQGKVTKIAGLAHDITERKRVEEALRESEEFTSGLLSNSPNPIVVINPDTSVGYVNPALEEISGFSSAELIGWKAPYPWWTEETVDKAREGFYKAFEKGACRVEQLFKRKNGQRFWVEITSVPVTRKGGFKYYLSNWVDITERKLAEEALQKSEETVRSLLNASTDSALLMDTGGTIIALNETAAQRIGRNMDELVGLNGYDLMPPVVRRYRKAKIVKVVRSGEPIRFEDKRKGLVFDNSIHPILDNQGGVVQLAVYARDITGQRRAEEKLRQAHDELERRVDERTAELLKANEQLKREIKKRNEAEKTKREIKERYRLLFNSSPDAIAVHRITSKGPEKTIEVNDRALKMFGYSREELLKLHPLELLEEAGRAQVPSRLKEARLQGHTRLESNFISKNGRRIPVEISVRLFDLNGEPAALATGRDITERKQAEEALRARKKELEIKTQNLEEANTALRVLLKTRDEDRADLEEKVLSNVKELILPYVERLRNSELNTKQRADLNILESNLTNILSSVTHRLSFKYLNLTRMEMQVATLVKEGKTTKEMANLLNSSTRAIEFHRNNIREKLGLKNTKANLRAYLLSLS